MPAALNFLVSALHAVPAPLAVIIISGLPLAEVRGGVLVALTAYKMPVVQAITWAIIGNVIAVAILLALLDVVSAWLRKNFQIWERFFTWLFDHTRKQYHHWITTYGVVALFVIAAIPFPPTGAWSACAAAFIFGLPKKKSFVALVLGIVVSAFLATALITGITMGVNTIH